MINGDYNEFLDRLNYGDELWIKYKGVIYFIQGWGEKIDTPEHFYVKECYSFATDTVTTIFHAEGKSMSELAKKLLEQPLFEGKTLPEVEQEIQWVDDEMG